ncbi:MAG: tRNA uridine-5-carboxymethylaminomethyl(34) synthesis enzyme MnmG [Ruminococcaceae bacterium]|nr:tRNA uridine-5-carboxymethylaminomethyl(34) synthesis enzyme MnmG [Oscillospiraceae bacterium]
MEYFAGKTDIAVIGAGHAGIEAAFAASRLGLSTTLFTLTLDLVGNMPCNPSIGGTGKGHLVYELDALGGVMGKLADKAMLQSRMLNESKGPAVHSLRLQVDRRKYSTLMKELIEEEKNLSLVQAEITDIKFEDGKAVGVVTSMGAFWEAKAVIISTGTSLGGKIIVGECAYESGPDNTLAATKLTQSLIDAGVKIVRFKTGTPPRIHADSIDYSVLAEQAGDEDPFVFSSGDEVPEVQKKCYIAYTNEETHKIIRENLHRSPLFSGVIKGVGPRYCPSIEDKVVRFPDKIRHQLFVEPMGENTKEVYLQGMSSSLPEEVQKKLIHSIKGLENAVFMRTAYAIEYDCADPTQLKNTLEFREIEGLYGAGQFNGSSGYEEAAVQGFMAGCNAALKIKGMNPFTLSRSESYIGTLIDDLVNKGTNEPYRIMTSRSEYRLLLRQDNTKSRILPKAYKAGIISEETYSEFLKEEEFVENEITRLRSTSTPPLPTLNAYLEEKGYEPLKNGIRIAELVKRPHVELKALYGILGGYKGDKHLIKRIETEIKYEGYIKKQLSEVDRLHSLEQKKLPTDIDYTTLKGLKAEAAQKLNKFRPASIGEALSISGISPADISVLLIYLRG